MLREKFLRLNRKISQSRVAELTGIVQCVISNFETGRGNLTAAELQKIATVFGVAPERLLDQIDETSIGLPPGEEARDGWRQEQEEKPYRSIRFTSALETARKAGLLPDEDQAGEDGK